MKITVKLQSPVTQLVHDDAQLTIGKEYVVIKECKTTYYYPHHNVLWIKSEPDPKKVFTDEFTEEFK